MLKKILELFKKKETHQEYWDFKRSPVPVFYAGRIAPNIKTPFKIDVRLFITPNDAVIQQDIINHDLQINNTTVCNNDILKIYKHTRTKSINPFKYVTDKVIANVPEFWMFPFEFRQYKAGDCEENAIEIVSYLIAAGLPDYRVRVVAGITWGGEGHATVYVLADDLTTWIHINSTTPIELIKAKDLLELPIANDPLDVMGIKDVWFSFNNTHAWNEFETQFSQDMFNKHYNNKIVVEKLI